MKSPRNNNTSLARTWYDMVKPPPPGTNILYFEKHLAERILSAMRIRQSSMVLYVFSCERPEEMSWFATKPLHIEDEQLWFPVDRQWHAATGGHEEDETSSCLIPTNKYGGFVLHKRFRPLLSWIRGQGLGFYLTRQKALVCYWHPGTGHRDDEKQERVLYNHYLQRLTRECDAQYLEDMRARIKRAMDAGQTMASVQILYASSSGFSQKTPETITEICLICHETKQVLTNATLVEHLQWVVNDRYRPLIEALDKDGLRWSLRFQDQGQYDWALMVATWV